MPSKKLSYGYQQWMLKQTLRRYSPWKLKKEDRKSAETVRILLSRCHPNRVRLYWRSNKRRQRLPVIWEERAARIIRIPSKT